MKNKLIAATCAAIALTGCAGQSEASKKLEYLKSVNPYEYCMKTKSKAELVMTMRQDGKGADHIYYELGEQASSYLMKQAFKYPVSRVEMRKGEIIRSFASAEYMTCVEDMETFQRPFK